MITEAQGKDAWMLERRGKFTASECHKLMLPGKNTMFSTGGNTYIEEKAVELVTSVWDNEKLDNVKGILWGKRYEEPAFNHYQQYTRNFSMRYFGTDTPLFLQLDMNSGGSPDGIMGEGTNIHLGLELKCPEQSKIHFRYWQLKDQWDLKKEKYDYYMQCQMLIMITKAPLWHWVSFDDRFTDTNKKMKLIEVLPDPAEQQDLEIRLLQAAIDRDTLLKNFRNN